MSLAVDIIKRDNKKYSEPFSRNKLHSSIVATCISINTPEGQAENIAHSVCDAVANWLSNKTEVTSGDIRIIATKHLEKQHPEAAYIYEHHKLII